MSSTYTPITFPAWFQPSVTLAYQITLDAYSQQIPYGSISLTANQPYTLATFGYTNKLQHTEFALTIFGYSSIAENYTLNLIIDGTTYLTQSFNVTSTTGGQNIYYSGYFNLPTGSHSCSITLTVATSATLTISYNGAFGIGNSVAGVNVLSIKTLTGNEVYAVLVNYDILDNDVATGTLIIKSKNNAFNLGSFSISSTNLSPVNTSSSTYYPNNYILGNNDTTQTINISLSGTAVFALIRRVVINEASVVLQNYQTTLATGLS